MRTDLLAMAVPCYEAACGNFGSALQLSFLLLSEARCCGFSRFDEASSRQFSCDNDTFLSVEVVGSCRCRAQRRRASCDNEANP